MSERDGPKFVKGDVSVQFVYRTCCCMQPGCVDDEIAITDPEEDDAPFRIQVPRLMTEHFVEAFNLWGSHD